MLNIELINVFNMSVGKYIMDAEAKLPNGDKVIGPITTQDDENYLFRNTCSDLDFYLTLKKGEQGWFKSGGPIIHPPQEMIAELGYQIDVFLIQNAKLNKIDLKTSNPDQ